MKYTFRSEKELQEVIQACADIPQKVIDNAKYHIGLVEECFEDGACGNFHILTDDDGIDSDTYKDCLREYNLIEGDYEFDDLICIENGSEWHIRAFIGTDAYWGFFYKCKTKEVCYGK